MKITEEQKQKLLNLNDSRVNEILGGNELEKGKWYKEVFDKKALYYITKITEDSFWFYGFDINGNFTCSDWYLIKNCELVEATHEEVANALINEAKRRGFGERVEVWDFNNVYTIMSNKRGVVFYNGKWAEVIEKPNKQEIINQINELLKQL